MSHKLVWLLKNSKIYKRIRTILLRLKGPNKVQVSPSTLFLMQHHQGKFNRYDLVVRLMAIENLLKGGDSGLALYHKMQQARNQYLDTKNLAIKPEDLYPNKSGKLEELVTSFKQHGFDPNFPITATPQLKLVDGSHRLACAQYFQSEQVSVKKVVNQQVDYSLKWFQQYFDSHEIQTIQHQYQEILKGIDLKEVLSEILLQEKQVFGRGEFYQSNEELGLSGQRPTTKRYQTYGLDQYLKSDHKVLDIGCNCGFFTLLIAKKVREAVGVEISETLVNIAQATQVYLGRENVSFRLGNFNRLQLSEKFDFICSFAVHHWLAADIGKYGQRLHQLLNPLGKVLLESQNIHHQDTDWDEKTRKFAHAGFVEIQTGQLKDDGIIERRFSVFEKN